MTVNANSIVQQVIEDKNRIIKHVNVNVKIVVSIKYFHILSDRIGEINRYMNSVNAVPIDYHESEFEVRGGSFDPSKLHFDNPDREKTREAVLRVLEKVVDLSSLNLQKNADGLLASNPHNKDIICVGDGEKRVPEYVFALFY